MKTSIVKTVSSADQVYQGPYLYESVSFLSLLLCGLIWILHLYCNVCIPTGKGERKKRYDYIWKINIHFQKSISELIQAKILVLAYFLLEVKKKGFDNRLD